MEVLKECCLVCNQKGNENIYEDLEMDDLGYDPYRMAIDKKRASGALAKLFYLASNLDQLIDQSFICIMCVQRLAEVDSMFNDLEFLNARIIQFRHLIQNDICAEDDQNHEAVEGTPLSLSCTRETRRRISNLIQVQHRVKLNMVRTSNFLREDMTNKTKPENFEAEYTLNIKDTSTVPAAPLNHENSNATTTTTTGSNQNVNQHDTIKASIDATIDDMLKNSDLKSRIDERNKNSTHIKELFIVSKKDPTKLMLNLETFKKLQSQQPIIPLERIDVSENLLVKVKTPYIQNFIYRDEIRYNLTEKKRKKRKFLSVLAAKKRRGKLKEINKNLNSNNSKKRTANGKSKGKDNGKKIINSPHQPAAFNKNNDMISKIKKKFSKPKEPATTATGEYKCERCPDLQFQSKAGHTRHLNRFHFPKKTGSPSSIPPVPYKGKTKVIKISPTSTSSASKSNTKSSKSSTSTTKTKIKTSIPPKACPSKSKSISKVSVSKTKAKAKEKSIIFKCPYNGCGESFNVNSQLVDHLPYHNQSHP